MEITLEREKELFNDNYGKFTLGDLYIDGEHFCVTLEDGFNDLYNKIPGKTRIPSGRFKIEKRKVLSGLTVKYRNHRDKRVRDSFDFHLEICDVPFFENVYIHIGNYPTHTDGCVLVGRSKVNEKAMITHSTDVYVAFYDKVSKALESGEEVWIEISN